MLLKERPGGLAYALYASTDTNRPSAEIAHVGRVRQRAARRRCRSNAWSHLATTYDGATLRLYVNGTQVASRARDGLDHGLQRRAADRRQRDLGRVLQGPDRRGARLQPRAHGRRDPGRHERAGRSALRRTRPRRRVRPATPTATRDGDDVTLTWTASTDDVGVTGYRVYRGATAGSRRRRALSYATPTAPATARTYTVVAIDAAGNASAASAEATVTVPDIVAAERARWPHRRAVADGDDSAWLDRGDDNSGVSQYRIHRSTRAASRRSGATSRLHERIDDAPRHALGVRHFYYRVVAVDLEGNTGAPSEEAAADESPSGAAAAGEPVATTVGGRSSWPGSQPSHSASVTYRIHRSTDAAFIPDASNLLGTSAEPSFMDADAAGRDGHYQRLRGRPLRQTSELALVTTASAPTRRRRRSRSPQAAGGTPCVS